MGRLEVPDKGEDPQAIFDHGQGIPLGRPLLAVKEVTRPSAFSNHQCGPVEIEHKFKPLSTGSIVLHRPQHVSAILVVE